MSEAKQGDSPSKTGDLICVLQGLTIEMSAHNSRGAAAGKPLAQSNSDGTAHRSCVLNGVRAKVRVQGTENMVPRHSARSSLERNASLPSSHSSGSVPNGEYSVLAR